MAAVGNNNGAGGAGNSANNAAKTEDGSTATQLHTSPKAARHVTVIVEDDCAEKPANEEFEKARKQHYDEIDQVRKYRKEHPLFLEGEEIKPVLKKKKDAPTSPTQPKHVTVIPITEDPIATQADPEQKQDHSKRLEFEQHRKQHYNEVQALREFRKEHPLQGALDKKPALKKEEPGVPPKLEDFTAEALAKKELRHVHLDKTAISASSSRSSSPEAKHFEEMRKQHYTEEIPTLKKFRKEHPEGLVDEDEEAVKARPALKKQDSGRKVDNLKVQLMAEAEEVMPDPEFEARRRRHSIGEIEPVRQFLQEHPEGLIPKVKLVLDEEEAAAVEAEKVDPDFEEQRKHFTKGEMDAVRQFEAQHRVKLEQVPEPRLDSDFDAHRKDSVKGEIDPVRQFEEQHRVKLDAVPEPPHRDNPAFEQLRKHYSQGEMDPVRKFQAEHHVKLPDDASLPVREIRRDPSFEEQRRQHHRNEMLPVRRLDAQRHVKLPADEVPERSEKATNPEFEQHRRRHYHNEIEPVRQFEAHHHVKLPAGTVPERQQADPEFEAQRRQHYRAEIEPVKQFQVEHHVEYCEDDIRPAHDKQHRAEFSQHVKDFNHGEVDKVKNFLQTDRHHVQYSEDDPRPARDAQLRKEFAEHRKDFNHGEMEKVKTFLQTDRHHVQYSEDDPRPTRDAQHNKEFAEHRKEFNHGEIEKIKEFRTKHHVQYSEEDFRPGHDAQHTEEFAEHRKGFNHDEMGEVKKYQREHHVQYSEVGPRPHHDAQHKKDFEQQRKKHYHLEAEPARQFLAEHYVQYSEDDPRPPNEDDRKT